jgi:sec-independent protein translocase protein TatA
MFEGLLSPAHLLIILAIALIVLGPKRLPEAGRGLGEAIRGFRESIAPSSREPASPDRVTGADEHVEHDVHK